MIYNLQKDKDDREDMIMKIKTENKVLRGNIKKLQEEKDEVDMEVEKYKKETYESKGEEEKKEEILELKQQ